MRSAPLNGILNWRRSRACWMNAERRTAPRWPHPQPVLRHERSSYCNDFRRRTRRADASALRRLSQTAAQCGRHSLDCLADRAARTRGFQRFGHQPRLARCADCSGAWRRRALGRADSLLRRAAGAGNGGRHPPGAALLEARRGPCAFVAVSGDLYTDYDYRLLHAPLQRISQQPEPHLHLVMVPNPDHHPNGDFALLDNGQLSLIDAPRLTFGNIGVYHMHMFHTLAPGAHCALGPYYRTAIAARRASGEQYSGRWLNIGAPEQLYALDAMLSGVPHNRAGGVAPPCRTHCTVCVGAPCQRGCAKLLRHSCSEI